MMSNGEIILMRGIQASGKTTRSFELLEEIPNSVRVSRDDLRLQLFGRYHDVDETLVTQVEDALVLSSLKQGKTVIIDAMHLKQSYVNRWQKMGYPVRVEEVHQNLDELRFRNAQRHRQVPDEVIRDNFKRFTNKDGSLKKVVLKPEEYISSNFVPYKELSAVHGPRPSAYIFDVDGTLAHNDGHRSFYDYSKVLGDSVHEHVAEIARALDDYSYVLIVTGRKREGLDDTITWLLDNDIPYDEIYSREDGDDRPDSIIKYEILRDQILPEFEISGVFDDRPSVCEMWRNVGIPTFQVGDPDVRF